MRHQWSLFVVRFSLACSLVLAMSMSLSACVHEAGQDSGDLGAKSAQLATKTVTAAQKEAARQEISQGRLLKKQGQPEQALAHFNKASELDPQSALARLEQAAVMLSLGKDEQDIGQALAQAQKLAPNNPRVDFVSGRFHESFGREQQALQAYHAALQKRQSYPEVLYRAAMLEEHFTQNEAAFAHYRQAYALNPDNSLAAYGAARIAVERRDFATGLMIYEELHQRFPKNRLFFDRLIDVLKTSDPRGQLRRYQAEYKKRYGEPRRLRDLRPSRR